MHHSSLGQRKMLQSEMLPLDVTFSSSLRNNSASFEEIWWISSCLFVCLCLSPVCRNWAARTACWWISGRPSSWPRPRKPSSRSCSSGWPPSTSTGWQTQAGKAAARFRLRDAGLWRRLKTWCGGGNLIFMMRLALCVVEMKVFRNSSSLLCLSDQLVLALRPPVPVAHCAQSSLHHQLPTPGGAPQTAGIMFRTEIILRKCCRSSNSVVQPQWHGINHVST